MNAGLPKTLHRRNFLCRLALAAVSVSLFGLVSPNTSFAANSEHADKKRWDAYSESEKEQLLKRWEELQAMPRDDQAEMWAALERYNSFTPEQKKEVEIQFERWKKLSPEAKEEIRAAFTEWQSTSAEEKDAFRQENQELMKSGKGAKPAK